MTLIKKVSKDFITYEKGKFYLDSEDVDTGKELPKAGDLIEFIFEEKRYKAKVGSSHGRDDDVYELSLL